MPDGREITEYTIENAKGASVSLINYGAVIRTINVPDKNGDFGDVTLGFEKAEDYTTGYNSFLGKVVGRFGNRIGGAEFSLNGQVYKLYKNNGENTLHGGKAGFGEKYWDMEIAGENAVRCIYTSVDGEEGYPGNLRVELVYSFNDDNELKLEYKLRSDKDTIHNVTQHAYFNLNGHDSGDVLSHKMMINADCFTPVSSRASIPTGEIRPLDGSPLDLRKPTAIGDGLERGKDDEQMGFGGGFDHNFVINGEGFKKCAEVYAEESGRVMEVYTDQPGVQFYSGNGLNVSGAKGGATYGRRGGFCLETQHFPDSIHHENFASPVLKAGETFTSNTMYKFSVR